MEREILQEFGFTRAEAEIYITLLRLGPVKVGKIIEKSGLQSSTTHYALHYLMEKGFVTYVLKGRMKMYQAVEPKLILEQHREKEKKFREVLTELETMQKFSEEKQTAEIYEGTRGLRVMLDELIEDAKPNDVYYFFAMNIEGSNEKIQDFFRRTDAKRRAKRLIVRGLARKELKPLFKKRKFLNVRYVDFPIPSNISICNDKMALIAWGEKPNGILVKSKQIIESEKRFFEELWGKSYE